jgi:hypothetical protein
MLLCYPVVFVGRDRGIWRVLNDTMTVVVGCGRVCVRSNSLSMAAMA